jgi:hypothetical protein
MIVRVKIKVPSALRHDWQQWRGVVALFANEQSARHNVEPQRYVALYQGLLANCTQQAGSAAETNRKFFHDLAETVRPWVSVESLDRADPEVLHELDIRCKETDIQLGCVATRGLARRLTLAFVVVVLALLAGAAVVKLREYDLWKQIPDFMRPTVVSTWNSIRFMNWKQQTLVAGAVVAIGTIPLVWRSARKY